MTNLFEILPVQMTEELTSILAQTEHVRIERIVSTGQTSPNDFWYDQEETEWVAVLQGEGKLLFEDPQELIHLQAGDHITIPAHRRHRVKWTSEEEPTIWLAVFFEAS